MRKNQRLGRSWKLEPTYNVWLLMPDFKPLDNKTKQQLALMIDLSDAKRIDSLPLGARVLCRQWRFVMDRLIDDRPYTINDLSVMLRTSIFAYAVLAKLLQLSLGKEDL